ncbi:MAG: hypothetical protein UC708_04590 [Anaerovoracaceae bacterium]|nr:hypothetical protein [Bacillota bacterium]MEE0517142.1 hypothetical protein [Anaerovoracaceae bacterium]
MTTNKKMAVLIFLMFILLATVGCATKTESDKIHEISLPNEDIVVMQMKFDENQRLLIAGFERNEDNSAVTTSVWRTDNHGESWESLYEKTFHSEKPGETLVDTEVYFTDDGLLMSEVTFTLENISDMSRKIYYVKSFETGDTEEILTSINVNSVSDIKFISEEAVYALDYRSRDFLKINILTEEVEKIELPQIKSIIYDFYNDTCVHFAYYIDEEYLNEQELQAENIDSDDTKEIYENYTTGIRYDLQKEQIVNSPVMKDFGTYIFIKNDETDYEHSISLAAAAEEDKYYFLYDEGLFKFDENGESLLYKDEQWKKRYGELEILYIDNNDIYIQAFEKKGNSRNHLFKISIA